MENRLNLKTIKYLIVIIILMSCKDCRVLKDSTQQMKDSYTLANKHLTATIKTKGAELASLKTETLEYIWQANPKVWPRHSPILFPIVGRLVDHEFTYNGETYKMKQHGFARDFDFKVIKHSSSSITFEQTSTKVSKTIYPFDFILQVTYTLIDNSLTIKYDVKNPSDTKNLYFSIVAHPAFNCPLEPNQKRNEYQLVFDKELSPKAHLNSNGLYEDDTVSVFNEKGVMELPDTIFDKNSLTFNPNPFSKVTLVHKPTKKKYVRVSFNNFPYLGIWSTDNKSKFVCIEPWYGIADRKDHNKDITQKEGIIKLEPNKNFECSFSIDVL